MREVIASLGRTEDVRFSPKNRRLVIPAYHNNTIVVFDIRIASSRKGKTVKALESLEHFVCAA